MIHVLCNIVVTNVSATSQGEVNLDRKRNNDSINEALLWENQGFSLSILSIRAKENV